MISWFRTCASLTQPATLAESDALTPADWPPPIRCPASRLGLVGTESAGRPLFGCYKPGAIWDRRFSVREETGSMMNSVERDGRCGPGLPLPLLFAPVILVTALLVVWPGWLRTAQAQSWVSEEGGDVRHIVVTINKSRTLRFDKPFASAVVGAPDIVDALPMSDRVLYIQGKKVGTTNVSVFDQSMKLIGVLDVEVAIDTGNLQEKIR